MAFITTNDALASFSMITDGNVDFVTAEIATSTAYGWDSTNNIDIDVSGTGFVYNSSNEIVSASTVTSVDLDRNNAHQGLANGDVHITGLSPSVAINISQIDDSPHAFWDLLLGGNDTFELTSQFSSTVFGDDLLATTSVRLVTLPEFGGYDSFIGVASSGRVIGDVYSVAGYNENGQNYRANYSGGDDTITAAVSDDVIVAVGDAEFVRNLARLTGGDDSIDMSNNTANGTTPAVGDVQNQLGGTVVGGNDTITTGAGHGSTGDVAAFFGTGTLTGGDDLLMVRTGGGIFSSSISGDVQTVIEDTSGMIVSGNDTIVAAENSDSLYGDVRSFDSDLSTTQIIGGNDAILGGAGDDAIYGETGSSFMLHLFTGGDDVLFGEAGQDHLRGQTGDDILDGGTGDDTLDGGSGEDWASYATAAGGVHASLADGSALTLTGIDTLVDIENLEGSKFADVLYGDDTANRMVGGFGKDTLYGGVGADSIEGGFGDDRLQGGGGGDVLNGGFGSDTADYTGATFDVQVTLRTTGVQNTGRGPDQLISIERLESGSGNDHLKGSDGANVLVGGTGDDTINGFGGQDTVYGGGASDFLFGGGGHDQLFGQNGNDLMRGNEGNDVLQGGNGLDQMFGGDDNDALRGEAGDDTLFGENGQDRLNGGAGDDVLRGGSGADVFEFNAGDQIDRVRDWQDGSDRIDLSSFGYGTAAAALADFVQQGTNVRFIKATDTLVIEGEVLANITGADLIL